MHDSLGGVGTGSLTTTPGNGSTGIWYALTKSGHGIDSLVFTNNAGFSNPANGSYNVPNISLTVQALNNLPFYAGHFRTFQLNTSGGSNWSSGSPITVSGGTNASLLTVPGQQLNNSGNTVTLTAYLGDAAGVLTLTDTVNSVSTTLNVTSAYVAPTFAGTNYYVKGGIAQPPAPIVAINGSAGSTVWFYQICAHNSAGRTQGYNISSIQSYNPPGTFNIGSGITTVTNSNATLSGTNYNQLYWGAIPGATSYDVLRSPDGSTWFNQSNTALTYYNDTSNTNGSAYTLATTNTTALGSDGANGLTTGTAWATLGHAASVVNASSGAVINLTGWTYEPAQVVLPAGIKLQGAGKTLCGYLTAVTGNTAAALVPGNNSYFADFTAATPPVVSSNLTRVFGNGTGDQPANGIECWRIGVIGAQSSAFFAATDGTPTTFPIGTQADFYDCDMIGTHGSFGGTMLGSSSTPTNQTINFFRGSCIAIANGTYALATAQAVNVYGCINFEDTQIIASIDTLEIPSVSCVGIRTNPLYPATVRVRNGRVRGQQQDFAINSGSVLLLDGNVAYDPQKSLIVSVQGGGAVTTTPVTPTTTNAAVYRPDALVTPSAASVVSGTVFNNGQSTGSASGGGTLRTRGR